jgi:hypothetical protein
MNYYRWKTVAEFDELFQDYGIDGVANHADRDLLREKANILQFLQDYGEAISAFRYKQAQEALVEIETYRRLWALVVPHDERK